MSNKDVYGKWLEAWNTDMSLIDEIAHDECAVHQARTDDHKMSLIVNPIEEGGYVSVRWNLTGKYNGKMEGVNIDQGIEISFNGTDIFYIENGKVKDYWVSSDGIDFMKQLGMI